MQLLKALTKKGTYLRTPRREKNHRRFCRYAVSTDLVGEDTSRTRVSRMSAYYYLDLHTNNSIAYRFYSKTNYKFKSLPNCNTMSTLLNAETNAVVKLDLGHKGKDRQDAQRTIPLVDALCEG